MSLFCVCVYTHAQTRTHAHTDTHAHTHTHTLTHTRSRAHTHTYIHTQNVRESHSLSLESYLSCIGQNFVKVGCKSLVIVVELNTLRIQN